MENFSKKYEVAEMLFAHHYSNEERKIAHFTEKDQNFWEKTSRKQTIPKNKLSRPQNTV